MPDQARIDRALDACYDAVVSPEAWPRAMDGLAQSVNAVGAGFYPYADPELLPRVPVATELAGILQQFMQEAWWERDNRTKRSLPLFALGRSVVVEHDIVTDDERLTLPVYNELYRPHGLPWWAAVACRPQGNSLWSVSFLRSDGQGPFLPRDTIHLARLEPHFARLVELGSMFAEASGRRALARFEQAGLAAVLVDRQGRAVAINPAAEDLLGSGLDVVDGRLTVTDPGQDAAFQGLVRRATTSASPGSLGDARPVAVGRGETRVTIDAVPSAGLLADAFAHAGAILTLRPQERRPMPVERLLPKVFGLTGLETRLAILMAEGNTLAQASEALSLSRGRGQGRLRAIYRKTGTQGMPELAGIVTRESRRGRRIAR